jgi:chromosomal replication initiation ATPase DnaA
MKREIFNRLADLVCEYMDIPREDLFKKSKKRTLVDARHLLYYLCSTRPMEMPYIIEFLNENGYSSRHQPINHGIRETAKKLREDPDFNFIVNRIRERVKAEDLVTN